MSQLSAACDSKRNEFAYLQIGIQALEGHIDRFNGDSQQKIDALIWGSFTDPVTRPPTWRLLTSLFTCCSTVTTNLIVFHMTGNSSSRSKGM
jgi:hypothetical protein